MSFQNPRIFLSPDFIIRAAAQPWEFSGITELRRQVFVDEQGIFKDHDRDDVDAVALPLVAISTIASEADQVVEPSVYTKKPHAFGGDRAWRLPKPIAVWAGWGRN